MTMMFNYKSFGMIDPSGSLAGFKKIGEYTMGDIGFQQNLCMFQFLGMKSAGAMEITCPKGTIGSLVHHGARGKMPNSEKLKFGDDWCGTSTIFKTSAANYDCTTHLSTQLTDTFNK